MALPKRKSHRLSEPHHTHKATGCRSHTAELYGPRRLLPLRAALLRRREPLVALPDNVNHCLDGVEGMVDDVGIAVDRAGRGDGAGCIDFTGDVGEAEVERFGHGVPFVGGRTGRGARTPHPERQRYAVACFANFAFAAFATSSVMSHVVFLTSGVRGYALRRYERSTFGVMPISAASVAGVIGVFDMVTPSFDVVTTSYTRGTRTSTPLCKIEVKSYLVRDDTYLPPLPPPRRVLLTWRRKFCRAKRAGCRSFGNFRAAYGVSYAMSTNGGW